MISSSKVLRVSVKCYNLMCALILVEPCSSTGKLSHSWGELEYLEMSIGVVIHFAFIFLGF